MTNKLQLAGILLALSTIAFAYILSSAFSLSTYTFGMDETVTVELESERSFYLVYNNVYPTDFYEIDEVSIYSEVDFDNGNMIFVRIKHLDSNDYLYLDGFGVSRSIKINDEDVIAEMHLLKGENEISISPASGSSYTLADEFEFKLVPSNFLGLTFGAIGLGISTVVLLIVFLYYFVDNRNRTRQETTFDGSYHHADDKPYDYDASPYDTYDNNNNNQ